MVNYYGEHAKINGMLLSKLASYSNRDLGRPSNFGHNKTLGEIQKVALFKGLNKGVGLFSDS